jgi:hypothetical protein
MLHEEKEKRICKNKTKVKYRIIEESAKAFEYKLRENKTCGDTESLL